MIAQASRKQISRMPRASRSSSPDLFHDELNIPHDSCQLFTCPTFAYKHYIGVDLLATTALRCHVSVMLLCRFAFRRFLLLTKANTLSELSGPTSPTPKKTRYWVSKIDICCQNLICSISAAHSYACSAAPSRPLTSLRMRTGGRDCVFS